MLASSDHHNVHLAPEFGLDDFKGDDTRVINAVLRQKAEPDSRCAHFEDPVLAFTPMSRLPGDAIRSPRATLVELAIQTFEITLIFKLLETDERPLSETMLYPISAEASGAI